MNETCNPLFVIGSGRSGTHLIAKIIDSSNEIVSNIEQNPIFKRAKKSVFLKGSFVGNINYQILKIHYKKRLRKSSSKYFLDKSHPNLFLTEKLNLDFQGAKFIAVKRNVYSTIASMLRHKGVSRHFINSKKFTHPNEFLGTNLIEHRDYLDLQNVEKACYR